MAKIKSIGGYRETEYEIYLSRRKQEDFQKTLILTFSCFSGKFSGFFAPLFFGLCFGLASSDVFAKWIGEK